MKKILFGLSVLLTLSLASCNLFNFEGGGNGKIKAPGITVDDSGAHIFPIPMDGMFYMNVFRYETDGDTDSSAMKPDTLVNLCQIKAIDVPKSGPSFIDKYVDSAKTYRYFIRYSTTAGYIYSNDSHTVDVSSCSNAKGECTLESASEFQIKYDTKLYTFEIPADEIKIKYTKAGVPGPAADFKDNGVFQLYMVISDGTSSFLFPLQPNANVSPTKYTISLRGNLPDSYYNRALKVVALLGQEELEIPEAPGITEKDFLIFQWTQPLVQKGNFILFDTRATDPSKQEIKDCRFEVPSSYDVSDYGDYTAVPDSRSIIWLSSDQLESEINY